LIGRKNNNCRGYAKLYPNHSRFPLEKQHANPSMKIRPAIFTILSIYKIKVLQSSGKTPK
jgi:hypothetical protein